MPSDFSLLPADTALVEKITSLDSSLDPDLVRLMLRLVQDGHTALPLDQLDRYVEYLNEESQSNLGKTYELSHIQRAVERLSDSGPHRFVRLEHGCLVWGIDHDKETRLASLIARRFKPRNSNSAGVPEPIAPEREQQVAMELLQSSPFCILTGGPGTGKSHVIIEYLKTLSSEELKKVAVAAPTGRASSRINEKVQELNVRASTVHRLLSIYPSYGAQSVYNAKDNPLPYDVVIIDEVSMLDMDLFLMLMEALSDKTRLILVGDEKQLPSILNGAVLRDLVSFIEQHPNLASNHLAKLTTNWRTANSSGEKDLRDLFQRVRNHRRGERFEAWHVENEFKEIDLIRRLKEIWSKKMQEQPSTAEQLEAWLKSDILILPLRHSQLGVIAIQKKLKEALGFGPDQEIEGMPILVRSNQPAFGLSNGDRGQLRNQQNFLEVVFPGPENKLKAIPLSQIQNYEDGFALTVHQSQGSEFDHVILALTEGSEIMMSLELFYTAITRTRKKLTLLASTDQFQACLDNPTSRFTLLKKRLELASARQEQSNGISATM